MSTHWGAPHWCSGPAPMHQISAAGNHHIGAVMHDPGAPQVGAVVEWVCAILVQRLSAKLVITNKDA